MKKFSIYAVPVILLCIVFYSCTTDPLIPPENPPVGFDSARYEWTIDTFYNQILYQMYIPDTFNIFVLKFPSKLSVYNGNSLLDLHTFNDMTPGVMDGLDKNNIYIGGSDFINNSSKNFMRVKKWNGSSLEDLNYKSDTIVGNNVFLAIKAFNLNEVWFYANNGRTILYDGQNFTEYYIDENYDLNPVLNFVKQDGQLFIAGIRSRFEDSLQVYYPDTLKIFRFENGNWEISYVEAFPHIDMNDPTLQNVNDKIYRLSVDGVYEFTGNSFIKVVNIEHFFGRYTLNGSSTSNLLVQGGLDQNSSVQSFYHWNGQSWSLELENYNFSSIVKFKDEQFFIASTGGSRDLIAIGRKKLNVRPA